MQIFEDALEKMKNRNTPIALLNLLNYHACGVTYKVEMPGEARGSSLPL